MVKSGMTDRSRRMAAAAVLALVIMAMLLPLWSTRMEAPQYRGDEQLHIHVYAGHVTGDLRELSVLNQYVGVKLRVDGPELKFAPWGFGILALAAAAAVLVAAARRGIALRIVFCLLTISLFSGACLLQYRLYEMGHNRGHTPFARVEDFTAPIFGSKKIANFTVHTRPEIGGWALVLAFVVSGWAAFAQPTEQTSGRPD